MDTIFTNSKNSKTSDPHRLLLNLTDKINLKWSDKYVALWNLSIYYTLKNRNKSYKNNKFKIKTGHYFELLIPKTIKLLGSTKSKISENENSENMPRLEIAKVALAHCHTVNENYQQNSRVLYTFALINLFGQLLDIWPKNFIFLKIFDSEFRFI